MVLPIDDLNFCRLGFLASTGGRRDFAKIVDKLAYVTECEANRPGRPFLNC